MKTFRCRWGDIVAEFLPPLRSGFLDEGDVTRGVMNYDKDVIIFLNGAPSLPRLQEVMNFYAEKGFFVIHPRMRGSFESGGVFLENDPTDDVKIVIDNLFLGGVTLENREKWRICEGRGVYIFCSSFSGPAGIMNSCDTRVKRVVALSPVTDFLRPSESEPLDWLFGYIKEAYGECYRVSEKNWGKLGIEGFYNPIDNLDKIDGEKVMILHRKDDVCVDFEGSKVFCEKSGSKLIAFEKGGHFSAREFIRDEVWGVVKEFCGF